MLNTWFKGQFTMTFLSGMEIKDDIVRASFLPNGQVAYLWSASDRMYNVAAIASMKKES